MSNLAYLNEYNRWFHLNSLYFLHYRYEYDYETAPNEVKAIESKVFTAGERLSEVINKINYNHQINGESDKTFFDTFEVILEGIQEMELIRLKEIKNSLIDFAESVKKMRIGVFDSEQKLFTEVENYNPKQEIQSYISNKSRYQDLEDIVSLYRQKGFNYVPSSMLSTIKPTKQEPIVEEKKISNSAVEQEVDLDLDTSEDEEKSTQFTKSNSENLKEIPDAETKLIVGDKPKLVESMSIAELPIEIKKKYQIHVNLLKTIRNFLIDAYINFTCIQTNYSFLGKNLSSSLFTQLNHEAISCINYVMLDLYYSYFVGSDRFLQKLLDSIPIKPTMRKVAKSITEGKQTLLGKGKETIKTIDLVDFLLNFFRAKIETQDEISDDMFVVYEQFMCIVWNSMFYIKLRQANFNETGFESLIDAFVSLETLDELTDEDGSSVHNTEFVDITIKSIGKLGEAFYFPFPLNCFMFVKMSRNFFTSETIAEGKIMNEEKLDQLGNDLYPFIEDILSIKPPYDFVIWLNIIWEFFLSEQRDFRTDKNEEVYSWLSLMAELLKKVSNNSNKILQCRLISVDLLHVYKIPTDKPLEFINLNILKLLNRVENSTIMLPALRITKDILINYKANFENNDTILKLIINTFKCSVKLCNLFVSDGFFENIIRKEIIEQAGKIRLKVLDPYSRPFTLRTEGLSENEISLVEVIKGFNNEITEQIKRYLPSFKNHLRKERHFVHSYSKEMKVVLEEEVKIQLHKLDFDNDPASVEICLELQTFDKLTNNNLCMMLKERIDFWTSEKLSKIRRVVDRCFEHEKWEFDPKNPFFHSHSAVDLFKIMFDTFNKLYDVIGEKFFSRWNNTFRSMTDDIMFDYCSRLLDDIGDLYKFKKLFFLPNLNIKERKLTWPMLLSQRFNSKKPKIIFTEFYDEKFEMPRICLRLGNLDYIRKQIGLFSKRFLINIDADKILLTIDDYTNKVITVLSYKLVYCEFAQYVFNKLYFIDDTKDANSDRVLNLEYLLPSMDEIMRFLHERTSTRMFDLLLPKLFTIFIELLMQYLQFYYQFVDYPELQQDQEVFHNEYKALLAYFVQEDSKEGLNLKEAKNIAKPFQRFIYLVGLDEYNLTEEFKNADQEQRQIISRILYRRKGKDADTFFNIYKSLVK